MELDDFKKLLNEQLEKPAIELGTEKIIESLQEQTNSVLFKLKKGVLFELASTIIAVVIFFSLSLFLNNKGLRIYFGTFSVLIIVFVPILLNLLTMINKQMKQTDISVKATLTALVFSIKLYMKRYKQISLLLIPVCISYAFLLIYNTDGYWGNSYIVNQFSEKHVSSSVVILLIIAFALVLAIAVSFINRWYLNLIYGRYLAELEDIITSLNE